MLKKKVDIENKDHQNSVQLDLYSFSARLGSKSNARAWKPLKGDPQIWKL
jgi:hypothetical protein